MIGSPVEDAQIRLRCWELALPMAGNDRHVADTVDKLATAVYAFVANGGTPPSSDSRDKRKVAPNR